MNPLARRMFDLVEPIGVIPYSADEPKEAMFALGFTNYWDTYFAGRAAPLGITPAEVVDALFYNFAPGEVARHIPKVWQTTTPEAAIAARLAGCAAALRRLLADHVGTPQFARTTDLLLRAATSAPVEGRPMYAALLNLDAPDDEVERLFHAASLLREQRGDGHIAALMVEGVGRLEAHVLLALDLGMPAEKFGRIHHLPASQLAAVIDGMRGRGLIGDDGWLSDAGKGVKQRVESLTDDLAAAPYESLTPAELDELTAGLEPLAALVACISRASRDISAGADRIFELIADPAQQPRWDGNDNLTEAAVGQRIRGVGEVFTMTTTKGAVRENHVVEFAEGRLVAWRPAEPGQRPPGHLWRWELEPIDGSRTRVTHTYDWTELDDETRLVRARATTPDRVRASLDRLADLAERD